MIPARMSTASSFLPLRSLGVDAVVNMTWVNSYGDFVLTPGTCVASGPGGSPLSVGGGCRFSLTYTPTAPGSVTAVVTATDWWNGHWGNMAITATGTPAMAAPTSIPTLSEWGLIAASTLVGLFGLASMRNRRS